MREIIERAAGKGAERCEVFRLTSLSTRVDFETGRLKGVSRTEESGVAVRVVKDGRIGFATSTRLDDLDRVAEDAVVTSAFGEKAEHPFAAPASPPSPAIVDARIENLAVEEMIRRMEDGISRVLDYEKKINAEATTRRDVQEISVATSDGFEGAFRRTQYVFYVGGRLVEGTNMLDAGGYYGGSALDDSGDGLVERIIEDFRNGRKNASVSGGPTMVLFTPRAMADVMMTLNQGLNGSIVERKVSPLTGKLGQTVFDERVTIHDDGMADGGLASAPFDDEGVPMQRTPLVVGGVLKGFITDQRTAKKLGMPATGNGLKLRRLVHTKDIGAVPQPEITGWEMAGGDAPHAELLDRMKSGVIVDSIMGIMMSNLLAGDFSGNVAYGLKVENGRVAGRVKDTMVAGNIYRLLKDNVVGISKEVERVGLMGFIGSHSYPYVLMKDVSISTKS
ncbi:MAG: TldD/PmbA family protein [Candidatus Eisenbacteria bacterium]|nr:TldD/PmbA family protein [Candidatus Eisenbacteria bacterium]